MVGERDDPELGLFVRREVAPFLPECHPELYQYRRRLEQARKRSLGCMYATQPPLPLPSFNRIKLSLLLLHSTSLSLSPGLTILQHHSQGLLHHELGIQYDQPEADWEYIVRGSPFEEGSYGNETLFVRNEGRVSC